MRMRTWPPARAPPHRASPLRGACRYSTRTLCSRRAITRSVATASARGCATTSRLAQSAVSRSRCEPLPGSSHRVLLTVAGTGPVSAGFVPRPFSFPHACETKRGTGSRRRAMPAPLLPLSKRATPIFTLCAPLQTGGGLFPAQPFPPSTRAQPSNPSAVHDRRLISCPT
jgi:hypothetical protein